MSRMPLDIHAICLALNEEVFIREQLNTLYPFCSGISILTQYDRDWYGRPVDPDATVQSVLNHPDPDGKIHLVTRRWNDEAAARNHEMMAVNTRPDRGVQPHGVDKTAVEEFHTPPDYFLIVDADEFYDVDTFNDIVGYLDRERPRGMRVTGYQYRFTWNQRIPTDAVRHHHFGFLKPGITFENRRIVSWNEFRLGKLLRLLALPDVSDRVYGFIDCPVDVGVFHHGSYLGGEERLDEKFAKHSHAELDFDEEYVQGIRDLPYTYVPTDDLPVNIREGDWPETYIDAVDA